VPKRILVADTSALLSLSIGAILERALQIVNIYVPHEVVSELESHSRLSQHAADVLRLVRSGRINSLTVENTVRAELLAAENPQIDSGEAEAIVLAEERDIDLIITDDFVAFPQMRKVTQARVHLSPYVIAALVVTGKLELEEAETCFDKIARHRGWLDAALYKHARAYLVALKS